MSVSRNGEICGIAGFRSHKVELADVEVHYVFGGEGPPLVLLHGWAQNWWAWRKLMPGLAERFTVIVPDLRGVGARSVPAGGFDKRTMAVDVLGLVEQLGLADVSIVGHDIGGMVAYAFAAQFPQRIRKLAIAAVVVPEPSWLAQTLLPTGEAWNWWWAFHSVERFADKLIGDNLDYYFNAFFDLHAHDSSALSAFDRATFVEAYSRPRVLSAALGWFRAFVHDVEDNREWLQRPLEVPYLALADPRALAAMTKQAQLISADPRTTEIGPAGHWIPQEQPRQILDALISFLTQQDPMETGST
jgi:pimeloyl-ACP methyl ester carboxylesterase